VCYVVRKAGKDYFLKATDVTFHPGGGDQATRIRDTMTVYTYERDLLELARMHAMTRVVRVLAAGDVPVKVGDPKTALSHGEITISKAAAVATVKLPITSKRATSNNA
jgi:hypothetical protein